MLEITDSRANIHLARQAMPTMAPVMMENYMKERLPDGSTMDYTHIATLQLLGIRKQAIQIHIFPSF